MVTARRILLPLLALFLALPATSEGGTEPDFELDGGREATIAGLGLGLFSLGHLAERGRVLLTPGEIAALDPTGINRLDRRAVSRWSPAAARGSDRLVQVALAAPFGLLAGDPGRREADVVGVMYLETMALSAGLTYLLKNVVGRTRPFVYNESDEIPQRLKLSWTARRSFPSGHTATAFAALVFTASVHGRMYPESRARPWLWGTCLTAAATTGYLRYAAGMHFPTDIIAGAAIGAFAGWVVPQVHEWAPDGGAGEAQGVMGMTLAF